LSEPTYHCAACKSGGRRQKPTEQLLGVDRDQCPNGCGRVIHHTVQASHDELVHGIPQPAASRPRSGFPPNFTAVGRTARR
jgi:hypothetical protein